MKQILTLFLLLMLTGAVSCSDEYVFHPYEPERAAAQELALLEYDFLAD